MQDERLET